MNLVPALLRSRPVVAEPEPFWRNRVPEMMLEEHMNGVERAIQQMGRSDFEHPRDLDYGRPALPIPETPDLFADGLEIAQAVLDWEERAGQPIGPLIEHIKAAQQLRKSVTAKAMDDGNASAAEQEVST